MPYLGLSAKNDIRINATSDLELTSDNTTIKFGADDDVTITHDPDDGLIFKSIATADDNPFLLTIQTGETDLAANDVIGKIQFQAPDEGTGTDAVLVSAAIQAVAEGDFSSSSNATSLQFMTGSSEAAATKMTVLSSGNVGIGATTIDHKLHLEHSDTTATFMKVENSAANLLVGVNSAGNSYVSAQTAGKPLILETVNTVALTIDSSQNATFAGNVSLADNKKAIFGTGNDLQIYHDGSHSYIDDTGTGRLYLRGSDRVQIQKYNSDSGLVEDGVTFLEDGAVKLYHNNANKLETTSSGVTVTGTATLTGGHLTVDNGYGISTVGGLKYIADSDGDAPSGGLIHNFYTDNGSTSALVIAKSGNVAIGDTNVNYKLLVHGTDGSDSGDVTTRIEAGTVSSNSAVNHSTLDLTARSKTSGGTAIAHNVEIRSVGDASGNGGTMAFYTDNTSAAITERMRITSAGQLSVGLAGTPDSHVKILSAGTNATNYIALRNTTAADTSGARFSYLNFEGTQSGGEISTLASVGAQHHGASDDEAGYLAFTTNDGNDGDSPVEKMRIDSQGKVGIGTARVNQSDIEGGLHVLDSMHSNWTSSGIFKTQCALRVETYYKGNNDHQRAIGDYGGGIGFNHLGGFNSTHGDNVHAWIGLKVESTAGHEKSSLVFATNNETDTSTHDAGCTERMKIFADGTVNFSGTTTHARTATYTANWTTLISHEDSSTYGTLFFTGDHAAGGFVIKPNSVETFRIEGDGKLTTRTAVNDYALVVKNSNNSQPYLQHNNFNNSANDNNAQTFFDGTDTATARVYIYSDGDIVNHDNSYGALSDERIKQDIVDANSQWDDIKAVKVRNFKKKDDVEQYGDKAWSQIGVIAQELEAVSPKLIKEALPSASDIRHSAEFGTLYTKDDAETQDAVLYTSDDEEVKSGEKEVGDIKVASTKQIGDVKETKENVKKVSYSVLYMKAIKALQEAMTRIETLEAKVATLEGS